MPTPTQTPLQDIADARLAVQELHRNQVLLKIASRIGQLGGWTVDAKSGEIGWSDEVFAIHGLPPGKPPPMDDGLAFYIPEHRDGMRAAVLACIRDGTPFDIEAQLIAATGKCSWVRAIGEAERDDTGAVRLIQGAFQDITERKEAHEQSRRLIERLINTLESITDAFFTLDRDWHFTYVNREAERVLQRSRKELLGKNIWIEFPPALGSQFEIEYRQAIATRTAVQFESFYPPLQCWFDVRAYPSDQGLTVYFQDVSNRREAREEILRLNAQLEDRVRQRTAQLEAANREMEAFSYSVAHDLRTPLTTIGGFSGLLAKSLPPDAGERAKLYLERIVSGVKQMNEMTDALLSLAQVSRKSLQREAVDLGAIALGVLEGHREQQPGRDLRMYVQQPLPAWGDPRLLRLLMENLLGNAWKFSAKNPVTDITVGSQPGPEGETVYFVRDKGAGFDMGSAQQLFGSFVRLHEQTEFTGTGMGLANVRRIVTSHGGRVWAESAPGEGATFYFTLEHPKA
ncbi:MULTISPECIES: ATP-binding protein [unclassified Polaromonas]|uniref:sensor histidine kinase n=1 Tax=unclassified Polaromonas TaxID=2638319 RepID=UPI000F095211|nr:MULTISPECIES: ATP-binding protein [unclassified Polaromonas]AYQ26736.1 PAS domain S-box protein [Polaromonas sp. SP1]QGJ18418.1 PAS domain-containing protein [Polaromonas sp. Pch-P]